MFINFNYVLLHRSDSRTMREGSRGSLLLDLKIEERIKSELDHDLAWVFHILWSTSLWVFLMIWWIESLFWSQNHAWNHVDFVLKDPYWCYCCSSEFSYEFCEFIGGVEGGGSGLELDKST